MCDRIARLQTMILPRLMMKNESHFASST